MTLGNDARWGGVGVVDGQEPGGSTIRGASW